MSLSYELYRGWNSSTGNSMICLGPEEPGHTVLESLIPISTTVGKGYATKDGIDRLPEVIEAVKYARRFPFTRRAKELGRGMEGVVVKVNLPENGNEFAVKIVNRLGSYLYRLAGIAHPSMRILKNAALYTISEDAQIAIRIPRPYGYISRGFYRYEVMDYAPGKLLASLPDNQQKNADRLFRIHLRSLESLISKRFISPNIELLSEEHSRNILVQQAKEKPIFWLLDQ